MFLVPTKDLKQALSKFEKTTIPVSQEITRGFYSIDLYIGWANQYECSVYVVNMTPANIAVELDVHLFTVPGFIHSYMTYDALAGSAAMNRVFMAYEKVDKSTVTMTIFAPTMNPSYITDTKTSYNPY